MVTTELNRKHGRSRRNDGGSSKPSDNVERSPSAIGFGESEAGQTGGRTRCLDMLEEGSKLGVEPRIDLNHVRVPFAM